MSPDVTATLLRRRELKKAGRTGSVPERSVGPVHARAPARRHPRTSTGCDRPSKVDADPLHCGQHGAGKEMLEKHEPPTVEPAAKSAEVEPQVDSTSRRSTCRANHNKKSVYFSRCARHTTMQSEESHGVVSTCTRSSPWSSPASSRLLSDNTTRAPTTRKIETHECNRLGRKRKMDFIIHYGITILRSAARRK
jgi:hypothetical protein